MSVLWSAGFVILGMVIVTIVSLMDPSQIDPGEGPIDVAPLFALLGAVTGGVFGGLLAFSERRKTFKELTLPRMALWGMIGGTLLPLIMGKHIGNAIVFAPLGAILSTATLALARRAKEPTLLEEGEGLDEKLLPEPR